MAQAPIRFSNGASYERMMGVWSQLAGQEFIDWLAPAPGLRWVDVGCGNGAFTQLLVDRCAPAEVEGVDPSPGQIAFARDRPAARLAVFNEGDAMALPFADDRFDAAVMALVIFFVPEPEVGVAEMVRVVRPGGVVSAYAWDIMGGGFPLEPMIAELQAYGIPPMRPPRADASPLGALQALWTQAGLEAVETRTIAVRRTFADFEDLWSTLTLASTLKDAIDTLTPEDVEKLKAGLARRLPADAEGRITYGALANAVKGRVPG